MHIRIANRGRKKSSADAFMGNPDAPAGQHEARVRHPGAPAALWGAIVGAAATLYGLGPRPPCVRRGPVAQWLEPAAHNGLVGGSNPPGPTTHSGATGDFPVAGK